MHKSRVFTFGFLISTLVMLAVMPVLYQHNSFSNTAMAQGYDDYNHYYDIYSKYPTEDKKYECQTGPFEGFFVSSVEFCDTKDKRHDDRDAKKGPTGDKGPTGKSVV